ncbi:hypothetical protein WR25_05074 [Diploscapter pachys]|uniref:Uncharacterized protein n=1 Tax=Diploscapter pachys TaxID=2018661 RepID=A0A2A2M641_9BILA|nr:hypothetical protein WR25_05074 [Diploscapter pachys]
MPFAATKPTPGKVPGPRPAVTLAIAPSSRFQNTVAANEMPAPGASVTPPSIPLNRSGFSAALAATASAPTRNGRYSSLSVGRRQPR